MDLELTDEQRWLSESIDTLLEREWPAAESVADAGMHQRRQVWAELVAFGALSIGGEDDIGAVEACLIARSLGSHLASAPFIASAALRLAVGDHPGIPANAALALALLEPRSTWSLREPSTTVSPDDKRHDGSDRTDRHVLAGENVAVEQPDLADLFAVLARSDDDAPAIVLVAAADPSVVLEPRPSFDKTLPMSAVTFEDAVVDDVAVITGAAARSALTRLESAGALLAAAEAIGAAESILHEACRYAGERRQFGRSIGSFQALRHLLADMYVRTASGWSAVLYAAAAFDERADDAAQTASVAKAYVARGAREVAHGAMQVFGGIAFTDEHAAHLFLRRIIVREQQFGDAAHHERSLGRALAHRRALTPAGAR